MAWTNIAKPGAQSYINVNTQGKEQYDQANILYDDPSVFYDGVNTTAWTNIAKPIGATTFTLQSGMITGLVMPLTYSRTQTITRDPWIKIAKPS